MIDIFYPYFEQAATWQELRYSLRSIEKNFLFDFQVWIVGDLPPWIRPGSVRFIEHNRIEGIPENTTYDAITKLLLFCNHADTCLHFIRMYDDIYVLEPVDFPYVCQYKAMYPFEKIPVRFGIWWEQLKRSVEAVRQRGFPGWNTETHLPEFFNKEKIRWVVDVYQALEKRLLTSTLYFNTFYHHVTPQLFSKNFAVQCYDNIDNEFYTSPSGDLNVKFSGKKYLNHNNGGLNQNLKSFLENKFPDKSKFEI